MGISAAGDQWNDSSHTKFCALFNRPFHAIKLEDGKQQAQLESGGLCWNFLAEVEFNPAISDGGDPAVMHGRIRNDVKFLSDASAEDANEMVGMSPCEHSSVAQDLICDPSAAGHASTE